LGQKAFVETYNQGALIGVGFLHGNPVTMTHEHIFIAPRDYSKIDAGPRNPLWIIGSCKISAFDRMTPPAVIGEDWALRPGGSIGVISSTTLSFSGLNQTYSRRLLDLIKNYEVVPQGVLTLTPKVSSNDLYYVLLGDPSVPIGFPPEDIDLSVFGKNEIGQVDTNTFYLGYEVYYSGKGVKSPRVFVRAFEVEKDTVYKGPYVTINYRWIPRAFFSGQAYRVSSDSLFGAFFVPFNIETTQNLFPKGKKTHLISLRDPLSQITSQTYGAWVIVYDPEGLSGHVGSVKQIQVRSPSTLPSDTAGPTIKIYWNNKEVLDSIYVPQETEVKVEVSDKSGVNTTENLPGGETGIVYILDRGEAVPLINDFIYFPGSDTIGAASVELSLGAGKHEFRVKAYDNLGNFSDRVVYLISAGQEALKLWDVLAYPNPVRGEGPIYFTFRVNRVVNAEVKVFTVAGRYVWKSGKRYMGEPGFHKIVWDGRDEDGDQVSNGVYLFKVTVTTPEGNESSKVEKLLIAR
jgi:flagellar hook assembly protein FlgD